MATAPCWHPAAWQHADAIRRHRKTAAALAELGTSQLSVEFIVSAARLDRPPFVL